MNKRLKVVLIALAGGLVGGFLLSELIGILGYLITGEAWGIRYLPFILPVVSAVAAGLMTGNRRGVR
ncbi:DUF5957 family protein [Paenibacillus sp. 1P07SE]|uniref:DUF5957 family protein n=1 Tax=Paenibacillus sp. 1P07SE TaxID=3132209 RepID=UPI0039A722C7